MDAKDIMRASQLDILFDGKNKAYGAYTLRKTIINASNWRWRLRACSYFCL